MQKLDWGESFQKRHGAAPDVVVVHWANVCQKHLCVATTLLGLVGQEPVVSTTHHIRMIGLQETYHIHFIFVT